MLIPGCRTTERRRADITSGLKRIERAGTVAIGRSDRRLAEVRSRRLPGQLDQRPMQMAQSQGAPAREAGAACRACCAGLFRMRDEHAFCSPHERSDMRGPDLDAAPDVASLIRATKTCRREQKSCRPLARTCGRQDRWPGRSLRSTQGVCSPTFATAGHTDNWTSVQYV